MTKIRRECPTETTLGALRGPCYFRRNNFLIYHFRGDSYFQRVVALGILRYLSHFPHHSSKKILPLLTSTRRGEGQHKGCKAPALCQFELVGAGKLGANSGITNEYWMSAMQIYNVLLLLLSCGLES